MVNGAIDQEIADVLCFLLLACRMHLGVVAGLVANFAFTAYESEVSRRVAHNSVRCVFLQM